MMYKAMMLGVAVLLVAAVPVAQAGCPGCDKVTKGDDGFCCGKGKAFGVELTSESLYKALEGHKADAKEIHCPGCKEAFKTNGKCSHCNVAAAGGKMYRSWVSHTLAQGKPVSAKMAAFCGGCKTARKENGRCDHCSVGFAAGRAFKDTGLYKHALLAIETLKKASQAAAKCEACAVAMVTNDKCEKCNVQFKDGKLVTDSG